MDDAVRSVFHTVDGVSLHAVEAGMGAPIALLHPEPGAASTFGAIMPRRAQTSPSRDGTPQPNGPEVPIAAPATTRLMG